MEVGVTMWVSSVSSISEVDMVSDLKVVVWPLKPSDQLQELLSFIKNNITTFGGKQEEVNTFSGFQNEIEIFTLSLPLL